MIEHTRTLVTYRTIFVRYVIVGTVAPILYGIKSVGGYILCRFPLGFKPVFHFDADIYIPRRVMLELEIHIFFMIGLARCLVYRRYGVNIGVRVYRLEIPCLRLFVVNSACADFVLIEKLAQLVGSKQTVVGVKMSESCLVIHAVFFDESVFSAFCLFLCDFFIIVPVEIMNVFGSAAFGVSEINEIERSLRRSRRSRVHTVCCQTSVHVAARFRNCAFFVFFVRNAAEKQIVKLSIIIVYDLGRPTVLPRTENGVQRFVRGFKHYGYGFPYGKVS